MFFCDYLDPITLKRCENQPVTPLVVISKDRLIYRADTCDYHSTEQVEKLKTGRYNPSV